jgi:uncharacterized protein (TIGR02246 family)
MKRLIVSCFVLALVVAGSRAARAQQHTDPVLDKLAAEFSDAFNAKDAQRITSFYADDAVIMPPNQPVVIGREDILAYYEHGFADDISDFRIKPVESAISGDQAFEAGMSRLTQRSTASLLSDNPPKAETGKYLVVFKRVNGSWKIAFDIFNLDD